MTDPTIGYLESCKDGLVEHFAEVIHSRAELFPSYSKFDLPALRKLLTEPVNQHLRAVETGQFDEVKEAIHRIYSNRLRTGFHANEMIRMAELMTSLFVEAIRHSPDADTTKQAVYCQRSEAIAQVAKMYTAILNLSIPKEERCEIEPLLLAM